MTQASASNRARVPAAGATASPNDGRGRRRDRLGDRCPAASPTSSNATAPTATTANGSAVAERPAHPRPDRRAAAAGAGDRVHRRDQAGRIRPTANSASDQPGMHVAAR